MISVRPVQTQDVDEVLELWSQLASGIVEVISYDRWGPGVPVPARPESVGEESDIYRSDPLDRVRRLVAGCVDARDALCLVASIDGRSVGFVTAAVRTSDLDDSRTGVVQELFVEKDSRRRGVATELVRDAVSELGRRGVNTYKVEVPPDWSEAVDFWRSRRHWHQDAVVFSRYN